ncbi:MAG TPA: SulP family inorganic anion transporter, partial [Sumerlaeia bacterium]|nr:SulP family inorganic anion transporter [Sumerlaeia bacterium]
VKLAFGLLHLGRVVRYVSNSVVVGFTAGAGILIAGNQLQNLLGVKIAGAHAGRFHQVLLATVAEVGNTNFHALAIAALTVLMVILLPRIAPKLPGPLIAVVASGLLVYLLGWHERGVSILSDIAPIERRFNIFHFPKMLRPSAYPETLGLMKSLSGGAVALAILGLVEAATSSRAVAASSGQRLNFSREFAAQGASNIVGAFFLNFASSGSFVRSALNYRSGGRTRMAAVFSALFTALTVFLLAPFANYIPKASLAGMLIVVAYTMVQRRRLDLVLKAGGKSRTVLLVTILSTLVLPLQYAIFVGVFVSIVFLLKITGKTDLTILVPREDGHFDEMPFDQAAPSPLLLVNMEGDLYFAAVEDLDYELQQALTPQTRVVLLRMKRLRAVGSTAMAILEHFWRILRERNVHLVVCGIEKTLEGLMTRSGLRERIGEQNLFYADNTLFQSTRLALARARGILDMERSREAARTGREAETAGPAHVTARDVAVRQVVRFGQGHSVREAVWLLSEMNRRRGAPEVLPLFLQGLEGKLVGELTPWRLLEVMTGFGPGVSPKDDLSALDDAELGHRFSDAFGEVVGDLANRDLPALGLDSPLAQLLHESQSRETPALPIRDDGGRIAALVRERDLLEGLGRMLHMIRGEDNAREG